MRMKTDSAKLLPFRLIVKNNVFIEQITVYVISYMKLLFSYQVIELTAFVCLFGRQNL